MSVGLGASPRDQFFERLLDSLQSAGLLETRPAISGRSWVRVGRVVDNVHYAFGFSGSSYHLGLYIATPNRNRNAELFESLERQRAAIENEVGHPLTWDFRAGRVRQQVWLQVPEATDGNATQAELRSWSIETLTAMRKAFDDRLAVAYAVAKGA